MANISKIERGSDILQRLELGGDWWQTTTLDYGIPLSTVVYELIRIFSHDEIAELYGDETHNGDVYEAENIVEDEAQQGRFGAFCLRRTSPDSDDESVEVWAWDDNSDNRRK